MKMRPIGSRAKNTAQLIYGERNELVRKENHSLQEKRPRNVYLYDAEIFVL